MNRQPEIKLTDRQRQALNLLANNVTVYRTHSRSDHYWHVVGWGEYTGPVRKLIRLGLVVAANDVAYLTDAGKRAVDEQPMAMAESGQLSLFGDLP